MIKMKFLRGEFDPPQHEEGIQGEKGQRMKDNNSLEFILTHLKAKADLINVPRLPGSCNK